MDDDVTNKSGIYPYLFTGEEEHLKIRAFSDSMKQEAFEKQGGKCKKCRKACEMSAMEGDHIDPWSQCGINQRQIKDLKHSQHLQPPHAQPQMPHPQHAISQSNDNESGLGFSRRVRRRATPGR